MTVNELAEQNLGLVHACAGRFRGKGIEYDDLYAAGCLGLVKAVNRFDAGLGWKFSTYAVPVILGEIRRLFREDGTVKLSRSLKERSMKARAIAEEYRKQYGAEIRIEELAQRLGTDAYGAQEALNAAQPTLTLSGENDGEHRAAEIPVPSPEEELTDRLSLKEALECLAPEEKRLIGLRYFCRMTQSDTAKLLGTSQVQISRREKKILLKMRGMLV